MALDQRIRLAQHLEDRREDEVDAELRDVRLARLGAEDARLLAEHVEDGTGLLEGLWLPRGEDRQLPALGRLGPADDRRRDVELSRGGVRIGQTRRTIGADRAHRRVDAARSEGRGRAVLAEHGPHHGRVVGEHRQERIGVARGLRGRARDLRAELRHGLRLRSRAIEDEELVAGVEEPRHHRASHVAEADESDSHERTHARRVRGIGRRRRAPASRERRRIADLSRCAAAPRRTADRARDALRWGSAGRRPPDEPP